MTTADLLKNFSHRCPRSGPPPPPPLTCAPGSRSGRGGRRRSGTEPGSRAEAALCRRPAATPWSRTLGTGRGGRRSAVPLAARDAAGRARTASAGRGSSRGNTQDWAQRRADMPAAHMAPHGRSAEYAPWECTAPRHGAVPRPAAARPLRSRDVRRGGRAARGSCCCPPRRSSSGEGRRGSGTPLCPRPPHRGAEGRARFSPPLPPAGLSPTITAPVDHVSTSSSSKVPGLASDWPLQPL